MLKRYVSVNLLAVLILNVVSCSKTDLKTGSTSTSVDENLISGVAATGAPISGGKVKFKGSDGSVVENITTEADGSYEADISGLDRPILVQVQSPSGEKYISVASQSALAGGKKINVTPISHIIVANVFEKADADDLFENFLTDSASYSDEKLEEQKNELLAKFVAAGLLGSGGVAGSDIDLLNGELKAGTSAGLDGLLDVLEVNTGTSAGIEVTVKGQGAPLLIDNPALKNEAPPAKLAPSVINESKAQLTVIEKIRANLLAFAKLHNDNKSCNGAPRDDDSSCDIDTLAAKWKNFFHADFQEEGFNRNQIVWDWFCVAEDDHWITSRQDCLDNGTIDIESIVLKDVTLIDYNTAFKEAIVSLNVYIDGKLDGSEDFYMKLDDNGTVSEADDKFKLLGNKKTFRYWIDTESVFASEYNTTSNTRIDNYSVIVSMWYNSAGGHTFDGDEVFSLTAVSGKAIFPNGGSGAVSKTVYLVKAPVYDEMGSCTSGLAFSTSATPYTIYSGMTPQAASYADACESDDPCSCSRVNDNGNGDPSDDYTEFAYFNYESQKLELTEALVAKMGKTERIRLTSTSGAAAPVTDEFLIRKPIVINSFNAPKVVPTFGKTVAGFCNNPSFTAPLSLAVGNGDLQDVSLHYGFHDSSYNWTNATSRAQMHQLDVGTYTFTPDFSSYPIGDATGIPYSHLYVSARDEMDRTLVRRVSCHP